MTARLCSQEAFAAMTGVSVDTVRTWVMRGIIPSVKLGQCRLINLAELNL
ncbi:MAG: helix-turn-helix domain-containing protein [Pseudomonas sp.]|nr:helix-turn-helix domain-containing protein [Pseudomonas sp.]